MKKTIRLYWISATLLILIFHSGCSETESIDNPVIVPKAKNFGDYWYQGKAELNRFELEQVRYGEIRKGDAALIFVTEDFLKSKQVKYEFGEDRSDVQLVLKLNFNRRFYTGVYPYSLLTSTFLPINSTEDHALKITFTGQEWCGHVFMQLNNRNSKFQIQQYSYFQAEGDQEFTLEQNLLEEEVWTMIRVNPDLLPTGETKVIPSMDYVRLFHKDYRSETAMIEKKEIIDKALSPNALTKYSITYRDLPRSLTIVYESDFPHQILSWEESYASNNTKGENNTLRTKAVRTNKIMLDYWSKNSVADSTYRAQLGLKQ
jgi:hypothetical protein